MRILPDTSVWIDFIDRGGQPDLKAALAADRVVIHPFVVGELALGTIRDRSVLDRMEQMHNVDVASPAEVRYAIERHALAGTGLGYVDAHILVSTLFTPDCALLTTDRRLKRTAQRLGIAA